MVSPGRLFWKLLFGNAGLMLAVMALCVWLIIDQSERRRNAELNIALGAQARLAAQAVGRPLPAGPSQALDELLQGLVAANPRNLRITVVAPSGVVLGDSHEPAASLPSHADRIEIRNALLTGLGIEQRQSALFGREFRFLAIPIDDGDIVAGVLRVAAPVDLLGDRSRDDRRLIGAVVALSVAAVLLFALGLASLWSRPIRRITIAARSLSRGDLSARASVSGDDEMAALARSLNQMRDNLANQLTTIDRQRLTLESLLTQLHEGVMVAGPDARVVLINPAAIRLLGLSEDQDPAARPFLGLAVEEAVPQHDLQMMLLPQVRKRPRANGYLSEAYAIEEARLQLAGPDGQVSLLARASNIALPGLGVEQGQKEPSPVVGRLLVLTDITELNRMLQVKADFVANASHELRTPLSAIRGAIETLSRIDVEKNGSAAKPFIDMISRHSGRLEAMVSDLLDLSRLESRPRQFQPATIWLRDLFTDYQQRYLPTMQERKLTWETRVPEGLSAIRANPELIRLTLDNLVDNAMHFTPPNGKVWIHAEERINEAGGREIRLEVGDTGCGIPEEEQPRVFERFYQVERARSGPVRGTGLGLSIVRHAVSAMNGRVELFSRVGAGTRITVVLPQPEEQGTLAVQEEPFGA